MDPIPPMISSYARLIAEHAEISARAGRLAAATVNGSARAIRGALETLADALVDHLATEDAEIHPRLMAARDGGVRASAAQARQRYRTLASDWITLIETWSEPRIAADRDGFVREVTALIGRLHERIREEDDLLYPAALLTGQMALRG